MTLHGFWAWFWAIAIITIVVLIGIGNEKQKQASQRQQMLRNSLLSVVDAMTGPQFELYFAEILRLRGHQNVQVVGGAGDGGVDILATAPDGSQVAYQCKRQKANVSVPVVRQLLGSVAHEHPGRVPHLATTALLTKPALDLARSSGVAVIDRPALGQWMDEARAQLGLDNSSSASASVSQEIMDLVRQGKKIQAIKRYRELTNAGLKEAKDVIDQVSVVDGTPGPLKPRAPHIGESLPPQTSWKRGTGNLVPVPQEIVDLVRQGKKIEAIKRYRKLTDVGLKDAKDIIDRIN